MLNASVEEAKAAGMNGSFVLKIDFLNNVLSAGNMQRGGDESYLAEKIDTEGDDKIAVCEYSGRICRITDFCDCQPHLKLPVDTTPLIIENNVCNCAD